MSDDKTYGFKLGDDQLPEPGEPPLDDLLLSSEMPPSAYDRLRRRITLVAVLLPLLLSALIVAGYLDIKRRVSRTENAGTMEVLNLSRDLESSFSSLSVRQAKLEESMASMIAEVQKKSDALKNGLKSDLRKTSTEIKSLKKTLAGLEKRQLTEVDRLKKELRSLKSEIRSVGGKYKSADRKMASRAATIEASLQEMQRQLADLAEAMRLAAVSTMEAKRRALDAGENLRKVKSELEARLATKLDRQSLSNEFRTEQQRYDKKMARLTARLSDRITTIEKQLRLLTTYVTRLQRRIKPTARAPKKMLEQDIKE